MMLTVVIALTVIAMVALITVTYMKAKTQSSTMYSLSGPLATPVAKKDLPWDMKTPSALRFAVLINVTPKTVAAVDCIPVTNIKHDTSSLKQSCTDYAFTSCACTSKTDCTNCTLNSSLLTPLLSLGNTVKLYTSGYTSQSDKPLVSTLLTIKTASQSFNHIESISLPAIPLQKWTVVTLVQEGRRIDVYYGEKMVASTYLKYSLVPAGSGDTWSVGQMAGWSGTIGLFSTALRPYSSQDVSTDVEQLVDTTGLPHVKSNMDFSFDLNLPNCIFGTCTGLPAVKPPNPFTVYASSVS